MPSLVNSTEFNTHPVCRDVVSDTAAEPFRTLQMIAMGILVATMWIDVAVFLYMRRFRRRLRIRGISGLLFGSIGGGIFILYVAIYDYLGREYLPCSVSMAYFYLFSPLVLNSDLVFIFTFVAQQRRRLRMATTVANHIDAQEAADHSMEEARRASNKEFFMELWNYLFDLLQVTWLCGELADGNHRFPRRKRRISLLRQTIYEIIVIFIATLPFMIVIFARWQLVPLYQPASGCTGCVPLPWVDFGISMACISFILSPPITAALQRLKDIPDPLYFKLDFTIESCVTIPAGFAVMLVFIDPGNVMREQKFDWFIFESVCIWIAHFVRCPLQIWRVRFIQKAAETNVKLMDVLSDRESSSLFERHLMAELANENLLFWKQAIKFKLTFGRDYEHSRQFANVLYFTFVQNGSQFQINISDKARRKIELHFKGNAAVGRNIFDDALIEVYLLMENGAFKRFVGSPQFKNYLRSKADLSLAAPTFSTSLAVMPSREDSMDVSVAMKVATHNPETQVRDITDYIHSL